MSTYFPKEGEIARKWYVVDASGQTLGRLATRVARILSGKNSSKYTPFIDTGDPGGLRSETFRKKFDRKPESVVELAVRGMLPKTKMGRAMASKLKVYRGDKHPHLAQKPEVLALAERA